MDYEDMDAKLKANNIHVAVFCSPHNPTGRVWERWEIEEAMEVYKNNECVVIADEIWSDLILKGSRHIPTQSISPDEMCIRDSLRDKYNNDKEILKKVATEDLRVFGMIPEFLGRLPIVFTLQGMSEDMLVEILKEPKNAILKQYQKLLALDEVKLEFDDGALHAIAKKAMKKDTGARALRAIIEEFLRCV